MFNRNVRSDSLPKYYELCFTRKSLLVRQQGLLCVLASSHNQKGISDTNHNKLPVPGH